MKKIVLETWIKAPMELVFNLARNISFHQESMRDSGEQAVLGVTSGLIGLGEEVTWEAKHFGVKQRLSVKVTQMETSRFFRDEMIRGAFKSMRHDHFFEQVSGVTKMTDYFWFEAPLGILGKIAEILFLENYMRKLLLERNLILKHEAESRIENEK